MRDYQTTTPQITHRRDDAFNTRQHAFNVGLAYTIGTIALSAGGVILFELRFEWILRGMTLSFFAGVFAFCISLIRFTQEAREIQWEKNIPTQQTQQAQPSPENTNDPDYGKSQSSFPHPHNKNGTLWTTVALTQSQREQIARTAIQHGKLTVNFLVGLRIKRQDAERLREELVGHGLLYYNERNEALVTQDGKKSFRKILQ